MTQEINKTEWSTFADGLSRTFLDWETSVKVLNAAAGAQVPTEGLPFNGLTFSDRHDRSLFELSVGSGSDNHQTHSIDGPVKVAFQGLTGPAGTLDIEDGSGTKTLITFIQPMPVLAIYPSAEMIAVG